MGQNIFRIITLVIKITLRKNYLYKLLRINEKQVYKRYAYFRAKIQRDFKVFWPCDIEAEKTSVLVGFHALQINKFYKFFRERIVELFEAESPFENGEIELDESYGHMMVW